MKKNKKEEAAIALQYESEKDIAPKILAKGRGEVAKKIIEKADETNIPIYEDPNLADKLSTLEMEAYIPEELYEAVAQVLVFISKVDMDE